MDDSFAAEPHCRPGCGACCIAPSISTPVPQPDGLPAGAKKAGQPCVQLDAERRCRLFGQAQRPAVCRSLRPSVEMCGQSTEHAMNWLSQLERHTRPSTGAAP
jgi:Fe-S-cluster containining protein